MRNLSYENQFSSQLHSNADFTHFNMKDFALELTRLETEAEVTRKWPVGHVAATFSFLAT